MDFLDPKKQRTHRIRLYYGYALMVIAISLAALLLLYQAYGYNFNLQTGDITQSGLLFVGAHPETADVYIDGQPRGKTDQRLTLPASNYTMELKRSGYRSWRRKFTIIGGDIQRFLYPFLFPENLVVTDKQLLVAQPAFTSQSLDRHWLLASQPGAPVVFNLTDLNTELANPLPLSVPPALFTQTGNTHTVQAVEWSSDNLHVVLKHTFDTGSEFVLVNVEVPASSVNLTRVFAAAPFTEIALRDKRFDGYYLYNQSLKTLLTAELQASTTSPLLDGVLQFKSHGPTELLYATAVGAAEGRVLIKVRDNGQDYTVRDLPADSPYLLDITRFNNRWYIVAGALKDQKIYVLRDPVSALQRNPVAKLIPAAILRMENTQFASFSLNARFVALQAGSRFDVYDAETNRSYRYDTGLVLPENYKATWMDGHRLSLISQGKVHVIDYDGTNHQTLSASYDGSMPFFDRDYKAMYSFAPSSIPGRTNLLHTALVVKTQ